MDGLESFGKNPLRRGWFRNLSIFSIGVTAFLAAAYFFVVTFVFNFDFTAESIAPQFFASFYAIPLGMAGVQTMAMLATVPYKNNRRAMGLSASTMAIWFICFVFGILYAIQGGIFWSNGANNDLEPDAQVVWDDHQGWIITHYFLLVVTLFFWGVAGMLITVFDLIFTYSASIRQKAPFLR